MTQPLSVVWLRRDLRLHNNAALYHALTSGRPVLPVFIFDRTILDALDDRQDRRVEFIHQQIEELQTQLARMGSGMVVRYGTPLDVWQELLQEYPIEEVFTNHDYEVYAKERDAQVAGLLAEAGIPFTASKDTAIFDHDEVLTGGQTPYTVFTPYSRRWHDKLNDFYLKSYPTETYFHHFLKVPNRMPVPTLAQMNFAPLGESFPAMTVSDSLLQHYKDTRDLPAKPGTSELSIHLRFGTISIRDLARQARESGSATFLNELCWRDFYFQVLHHFPHVEKHSFRREYDHIAWRNNEEEFDKWCRGETGYPLVDAGMRQLNTIGWMHNRVRMVTASFLCKHLLIDWRWGEAYFARKLRDYDLSANNGGWQWAAGSGTDAAPYFRVFNPTAQAEKFDPKGEYIRKWVPEFNSLRYARPMVDHAMARQRAIDTYKRGLKKEEKE
ncbi:deoxyribodipyrimidine photo-lyase [Rudanella paleaurantiibacter]|uniref:Deoxyribodipyrimidine photo-lyase n=1 Tax=Rudanella paleaurantiibacter TaxID=2614655 RepID=A0A7J5TWS0_9BACT|nr:deoxyribodipyrimidine photo-lyase [Rudanella paleaurantiibacter]KAB7729075.1 deoxyribodipyrimidine photo-lyase [Rudanella paleaurantiibacter]